MKKQDMRVKWGVLACWIVVMFLSGGCSYQAGFCPTQSPADLSGVIANAVDKKLVFRYPLDKPGEDIQPYPAVFCSSGDDGSGRKYHAAEDYYLPAGTPVHAMADGTISFSGPMGGYGWLIIIDHPQANLYSLYGHLSPSRWRLESGPVERGDLIAYLGDSDENGGSPEQPLVTHLHFGIRAGQRTDYPGMGEWRWMAGWIKPCPADIGWLNPSQVITSQEMPPGGYPEPDARFIEKWVVEFGFICVYGLGGALAVVHGIRTKRTYLLLGFVGILTAAGWILGNKGTRINYALFSMAGLVLGVAIYQYVRRSKSESNNPSEQSSR